jgi:hypothetical protein
LDIIREPYFDVNFKSVLYLSDTGRNWSYDKVSGRDKVDTEYDFRFRSNVDILNSLNKEELPSQLMVNIHPKRWTDNHLFWIKELFWQNVKNDIKRYLFPNNDGHHFDSSSCFNSWR